MDGFDQGSVDVMTTVLISNLERIGIWISILSVGEDTVTELQIEIVKLV